MFRELNEKADRIVDRAAENACTLGVFLFGDKVKVTRITTMMFAKGVRDYPANFVGCYDGFASSEQIVADVLETKRGLCGE